MLTATRYHTLEYVMDSYSSYLVSVARSEDYAREAAAERQGRAILRQRKRHRQAEPRPAPAPHEVTRAVTA